MVDTKEQITQQHHERNHCHPSFIISHFDHYLFFEEHLQK